MSKPHPQKGNEKHSSPARWIHLPRAFLCAVFSHSLPLTEGSLGRVKRLRIMRKAKFRFHENRVFCPIYIAKNSIRLHPAVFLPQNYRLVISIVYICPRNVIL